jgi:hypothetical protein
VTSIGAWVLKSQVKKYMERGLGREVKDDELTSISAWMKVPPEKQVPSSNPGNAGLIYYYRCGAPNYNWAQACHHCFIPLKGGPPGNRA